jgi:cytoskeletal protein CcmA (bactofilin family)
MKLIEGSTVIGKSVIVRGELSGNEDLHFDGDLEGTITLANNCLTLGPNARVIADIRVRDLVVFGNLKGNVQATGRIDLRQSGVLTGDVIASRLAIEESAVLQGRVELVTPTAQSTPTSVPNTSESSHAGTSFVLEPNV